MNRAKSFVIPAVSAASIALFACSMPARASSNGVDDALLRMQHEAELRQGERLLVAWHRHKESTYRFCIPEQPGDIKLKVLHDGETTEVLDGTCETVTGRHIDILADSKIPRGEVLGLKFEKVRAA